MLCWEHKARDAGKERSKQTRVADQASAARVVPAKKSTAFARRAHEHSQGHPAPGRPPPFHKFRSKSGRTSLKYVVFVTLYLVPTPSFWVAFLFVSRSMISLGRLGATLCVRATAPWEAADESGTEINGDHRAIHEPLGTMRRIRLENALPTSPGSPQGAGRVRLHALSP